MMQRRPLLAAIASVVLAGCGQQSQPEETTTAKPTPTPTLEPGVTRTIYAEEIDQYVYPIDTDFELGVEQ